jgi:hypothetical protein
MTGDPYRDRVQGYLRQSPLGGERARVVPLTGDASDRRYYRVLRPGAASVVLQVYASPFDFASLPFANVADLFRRVPMPVPAILDHDGARGILALEDLGDVTLQASVGATPAPGHAALYRQAVELIVALQTRGEALRSEAYLPYGIAFDEAKLTWELDFFVRHFLGAYRGVQLSPGTESALKTELATMVVELAAERRVLCHRDYHSRNLMLHGGRLHVIDFQDARLGPDTYDLVSLLRDSYVELAEESASQLMAAFHALTASREPEPEFRARFDLMALQRNLKALGTFGYQTVARQNPVYIQYIPRTLRYVRDTLAAHRRFARLREILSAELEELRG